MSRCVQSNDMERDFLKCLPTAFVVGDEYEILITAKNNGIIFVQVAGETFYEENSGILSSEKNYAKIRLPQGVLDSAKEYEIVYRETVERKAYFSTFKSEQRAKFAFKPLEKTENIHIYHVADIHGRFVDALKTAEYFGDETDLFIINGDVCEVETQENYFEACRFVGALSKGEIPVLFSRGNHDVRGRLAELYTDYFPCNGKSTYYTFRLGCLHGVVLDCGEDKQDDKEVLGGTSVFSIYRRKQTEFLRRLTVDKSGLCFAVCHISPVTTSYWAEKDYIIERETYEEWNKELERLDIAFLLCGHLHKAIYMPENSEYSLIPHAYPVVTGSAVEQGNFIGTAITVKKESVEIAFTDVDKEVVENHIIER